MGPEEAGELGLGHTVWIRFTGIHVEEMDAEPIRALLCELVGNEVPII